MCVITYICLSLSPCVRACMCVLLRTHTHTHTVCCNVEDSVLRVIRAAPPSIKVITFPKPGNFKDIIITFLSFSRSRSFSLSRSLSLSPSHSLAHPLMAYIQKSLEILTALGTNIAGRLSQRIRYYKIFGFLLSLSLFLFFFSHSSFSFPFFSLVSQTGKKRRKRFSVSKVI